MQNVSNNKSDNSIMHLFDSNKVNFDGVALIQHQPKGDGYSVRCLKD